MAPPGGQRLHFQHLAGPWAGSGASTQGGDGREKGGVQSEAAGRARALHSALPQSHLLRSPLPHHSFVYSTKPLRTHFPARHCARLQEYSWYPLQTKYMPSGA